MVVVAGWALPVSGSARLAYAPRGMASAAWLDTVIGLPQGPAGLALLAVKDCPAFAGASASPDLRPVVSRMLPWSLTL